MDSGEELVALAATLSIKLSDCMNFEGLCVLIEFLGLLKHNLEIIKIRRIAHKHECEHRLAHKSDKKSSEKTEHKNEENREDKNTEKKE